MTADRPLVHYAPPSGWLNDPNGLVHHDGEYHLFFQHHPDTTQWGPMHWGHAVSADLLSWSDLPIALRPDDLGVIYSGSAVVDHTGAAGFGRGALVALFTHHAEASQVQSLAYSTDRGRTWTPYAGNPVLRQPDGIVDFRDPKVLWYDTPAGGHWVMALAAGDHARFYASADLRAWEPAGVFAPEDGSPHGVWETPDLIDLPVDGRDTGEHRWVLSVGAWTNAPAGGSGTRYWVGDFDGATFTPDPPGVRWADHGADFYAAQSWSGVPDGRRIWIAWMSNWAYAGAVPATGWRGRMTAPRELRLVADGDGLVLAQRPVAELGRWLGAPLQPSCGGVRLDHDAAWIRARFAVAGHTSGTAEVVVDGTTATVRIAYDATDRTLALDRTGVASDGLGAGFAAVHRAPLDPTGGRVDLDVLVDRASVEVFANDGRVVLTDLAPGLGPGLRIGAAGDLAGELDVRPLRRPASARAR